MHISMVPIWYIYTPTLIYISIYMLLMSTVVDDCFHVRCMSTFLIYVVDVYIYLLLMYVSDESASRGTGPMALMLRHEW
jgi:hypothetical protein